MLVCNMYLEMRLLKRFSNTVDFYEVHWHWQRYRYLKDCKIIKSNSIPLAHSRQLKASTHTFVECGQSQSTKIFIFEGLIMHDDDHIWNAYLDVTTTTPNAYK